MPETPPRGKVEGWSRKSTGRLRRWFFTVDGDRLDGQGVAVTLTVRDLPPAAADWTRTRHVFLKRMRRAGLVRGQWLTEWQRRGVPHLHGCLFLPKDAQGLQELVTGHWLASAAEYGPTASAQHITPLWGLSGWLQYQAKHSNRGMRHYQRANVPESWRTGTGRLWGVVGDWPTREELAEISGADFHRFRRLLRSWLVAEARKTNDPRRAAYLRGLLRDPEPTRSRVRAVGEFCPEHVSRELLAAATYGELIEFVSPELAARAGHNP